MRCLVFSSANVHRATLREQPTLTRLDNLAVIFFELLLDPVAYTALEVAQVNLTANATEIIQQQYFRNNLDQRKVPVYDLHPAGNLQQSGSDALALLFAVPLAPRIPFATVQLTVELTFADQRVYTLTQQINATQRPLVIGAPLRGGGWYCTGNSIHHHHQRVMYMTETGETIVPQRFALDLVQYQTMVKLPNNMRDGIQNKDLRTFGQAVLAVKDAHVVDLQQDLPDKRPFENPDSTNLQAAVGNYLILATTTGHFVLYAHLMRNSICVNKGDWVQKGAVIAAIGNSGNSTQPHLHLQVSETAAPILESNGLPFVFDCYRHKAHVIKMSSPITTQVIKFL